MGAAPRRRNIALAGSHRAHTEGAKAVGQVATDEPVVVWIYLKDPAADVHAPGSAADLAALARPTTRRALARQRAAALAPAIVAIRRFAKKNDLRVRSVQAARQCVVLRGTAARMSKLFGASLRIYEDGRQRFRARSGSLKVPRTIARWTRAVLGFDQRPQIGLRALAGDGAAGGLWPSEVAALYGIPLARTGPSQCIGIIALGGGYLPSDVAAAAAQAGRRGSSSSGRSTAPPTSMRAARRATRRSRSTSRSWPASCRPPGSWSISPRTRPRAWPPPSTRRCSTT